MALDILAIRGRLADRPHVRAARAFAEDALRGALIEITGGALACRIAQPFELRSLAARRHAS
jgi:hypothetical protein